MPTTIPDLINWCNVHEELFTNNAAEIGLSASQAADFKAAADALVTANADAQTARQASKDATMTLRSAVEAVRTLGNADINIIKAYAATTGNNDVYAKAGITPSDPPSTLPKPVAPTQFTAGVNTDGSITIRWKVSQPAGMSGVTYIVTRRINGGDGPFTIVSNEGSNKSFTDLTLPIGVDKVEYIVQPKRGMDFGPQSPIFTVQFGSVGGVGGGAMNITTTASVPHAEPMKIAA
jgi:hypothetical protein